MRLIGPATKKRNFVAAADVAEFAVLALTDAALPGPVIEIGSPGNFSNGEVTALYARLAGIAPRISHLPAPVARALSFMVWPFHPGIARVLRLAALPDDAFDECFDSTDLERDFAVRLTRLEAFVSERVAEHQAAVPR
jgi:nucleoside-diphosphate-sugar epimerase